MNLDPLKNFVKVLSDFNTKDEVIEIVESNNQFIVALQQKQVTDGIDIAGNNRDDEYAPLTIKIKKEYGQGIGAITDHVTFFMTGQLNNSFYFSIDKDEFKIKSDLPTYDKMVERIGNENFGLSPSNREDFAKNILLPDFFKALENKTGLKL